ncbi:hypothetical protein SKAU_G00027800 [Synaphobranchus kaupii]|uniref:Uncharacterized protein n=1 Tax=Synaphobranchus kaupii TaxID=118154 RepID=A0A9Q1JF68_SYNKA|nr:hypothetical protein SKAU_G00027800 [Synaphobranchus kaupii]
MGVIRFSLLLGHEDKAPSSTQSTAIHHITNRTWNQVRCLRHAAARRSPVVDFPTRTDTEDFTPHPGSSLPTRAAPSLKKTLAVPIILNLLQLVVFYCGEVSQTQTGKPDPSSPPLGGVLIPALEFGD